MIVGEPQPKRLVGDCQMDRKKPGYPSPDGIEQRNLKNSNRISESIIPKQGLLKSTPFGVKIRKYSKWFGFKSGV